MEGMILGGDGLGRVVGEGEGRFSSVFIKSCEICVLWGFRLEFSYYFSWLCGRKWEGGGFTWCLHNEILRRLMRLYMKDKWRCGEREREEGGRGILRYLLDGWTRSRFLNKIIWNKKRQNLSTPLSLSDINFLILLEILRKENVGKNIHIIQI